MPTGLTKLQAVNRALESLGEFPVSSLDTGGSSDAALAESILDRVTIEISQEGWFCNTEHNVSVTPDIDGFIQLSTEWLHVDTDRTDRQINVCRRGDTLFNLDDRTFIFTGPIILMIIKSLDFDDISGALKSYITVQAARELQQATRGSVQGDQFTAEAVLRKRVEALHESAMNADDNLLDQQWARQIMGRRNRENIDTSI